MSRKFMRWNPSTLGSEVMRPLISDPTTSTQIEFNRLCELGGGVRGGPARTRVCELLRSSGQELNQYAYSETARHMATFAGANPWYICFAIGLSWGNLAKLQIEFTGAVVSLLRSWNDADLHTARTYHLERGPEPIEQSLRGAHILFSQVTLPDSLPDSLERLNRAQERWLTPVLRPSERPPYIGGWNATAMFMMALFARPELARRLTRPGPVLPSGGPTFRGLQLLYQAGILSRTPAGTELDDAAFEPGVLYENNDLFSELRRGRSDWSLVDVHSGLYMLGTRRKMG
jgi:hypothetical protein